MSSRKHEPWFSALRDRNPFRYPGPYWKARYGQWTMPHDAPKFDWRWLFRWVPRW